MLAQDQSGIMIIVNSAGQSLQKLSLVPFEKVMPVMTSSIGFVQPAIMILRTCLAGTPANKSLQPTATVPHSGTLLAERFYNLFARERIHCYHVLVLGHAASSAPSFVTAAAAELQRSAAVQAHRS